ncbi:MAG: DUF5309 family protein [Phycisphaerales bacterium]|nr:DUF5309 family protein [Phycisphaerales bacterium]
MSFTGKSTFDAGSALPEIAQDVGDVIGIVSPHETPLLDHLGDARRAARSTVHEWLEDSLFPSSDQIDQSAWSPNATNATQFNVDNRDRFRPGDQIRAEGSAEVMLVTAVAPSGLTVVRGYGGTTRQALADNQRLHILGNAALEGAEAGASRTRTRLRRRNYTQIFTAAVQVSGSQLAAATIGVDDELDYQMQERLRELLRDLENCVINGVAAETDPQGSASVRRTMNGIIRQAQTNRFRPGVGPIPAGGGGGNELSEAVLNAALRAVWEQSSGTVDTIVVNGTQKRRINQFVGDSRSYMPADDRVRDLVSVYESDFGVCRVILSRWTPADTLLLLDSTRLEVVPMLGRSFHFKRLASTGDREAGQVLGEYTLAMWNENAHAVLSGLAV